MKTVLKIAWRSIWRNRRRTLISMSAVGIGLVLIIYYSALMEGVLSDAKNQLDNTGMGHVEVTAKDWRAQRDVRAVVNNPGALFASLKLPEKTEAGWRVVSRGLLTSARGGEGVELHGVNWAREAGLSAHISRVQSGELPAVGDARGILIGEKLAKRLKVGVGGRVRLMVQGADGELAANLFRVRGIFSSSSPAISQRRVLVDMTAAQKLLGLGDAAHQFVFQLDRAAAAEEVAAQLRAALGAEYEVLSYGDLLPALRNMEELSDSVLWVAALFVYLLVGLGILNTMLMSVLERTREFGILRAIGTRPTRVVAQVLGESFWIATLSAALGLAIGLALTWYGSQHALLDMSEALGEGYEFGGAVMSTAFRTAFSPLGAFKAAALVYLMALLTGIYPAWKVARMSPAGALHAS
jgi:ABC-type lipoprotein release transport system permease subunit